MASHAKHDYHIIEPSIWPFVAAVSAFVMLFGAVLWFKGGTPLLFLAGFAGVLFVMYSWWSEVIQESHAGDHTPVVYLGLRYGFILFIISEVMFFLAWFWAYFRYALFVPEATTDDSHGIGFAEGGMFPPEGIHAMDPLALPLVNTLILLLSGCTLTAAHHYLMEMREGGDEPDPKRGQVFWALAITTVLGAIFLMMQAVEYYEAIHHYDLTLQNTFYGAAFFMATGFHGAHVLIGTLFLAICLIRVKKGHFTPQKHIGFEAAAWYWHFVDVVWLFLFFAIYVGSAGFFNVGGH